MKHALPLLAVLTLAIPAAAQDHSGHAGHDVQAPEPAPTAPAEGEHGAHGATGIPMDHGQMSHGQMDQDAMDHSQMDHAAHAAGQAAAIPQSPPPPAAFEGPLHAADEFVGADVMAASRAAVTREVSGMPVFWIIGDRTELRIRDGKEGYLWDLQGYYGGDTDKFWFKSEGEGSFGEDIEGAEIQALWSHAIGPWWDLQTGLRQDLTGEERTHAAIGVQGLAPYLFEVDAAAFISNKGDVTARIEAELDQRLTQRLILQPRLEVSLSAQDIPELGIGSGLDRVELGLRLRYEFVREFAPYIGVEQEWLAGGSRDYAKLAGEDSSVTNFVLGVRFWF